MSIESGRVEELELAVSEMSQETRKHWNAFYQQGIAPTMPSSFATFCLDRMIHGGRLFELGCGNGRDAAFFALQGFQVSACDQSKAALDGVALKYGSLPGLTLLHRDMADLPSLAPPDRPFYIYSRFSLHAVDGVTATAALAWSYRNLKVGGSLFIEARTIRDPLFGQGLCIGRNEYVNGHYRRFIDSGELRSELSELGFQETFFLEADNLATLGSDNPVLLRIVVEKKE